MTAASTPLDPRCPCGSARRLMQCCGAAPGGEFTEDDIGETLAALTAFGNRDEFAAAIRRNNRELVADLTPGEAEMLFDERELDMRSALVVLLHTELPSRRSDSLASLLLQRNGKAMAARPRALLAQWAAQPLSLYEVIETFPGEGLVLRDRLRRFTVRVHEQSASKGLEPGWFVITRVRLRPDGVPVLDMPLMHFEADGRDLILEWLDDMEIDDPGRGEVDPRPVIAGLFALWQEYMAEALDPPPLRLQNTAGDELVLCKATFEVADCAAVLARLAARRDWEQTSDGTGAGDIWTWFEPAGGEARRALGRLTIDGTRAVLDVNSRERLATARAMLTDLGFVFVAVEETTGAEMAARGRMRAVGEAPAVPAAEARQAEGEEAEVVRELLDRHYRKWVDEPVPMFGGQSPREMARHDPDAVAREIWSICNGRGSQRYDASWMYAELGVPPLGKGRFEPGVAAD